ncbi:MAG: [protein-PII] uridylyltransferase [Pseudomonadota bacterium]
MDQKTPALHAPYFDRTALRQELTGRFTRHQGTDTALRGMLLERMKGLCQDAREQASANLHADGNGRRCAEGLALFQDELIELIYDFAVTHVYRATNPTSAERMAVVATGGYGRGLLAPGSDIDLLFLLPYKQTPWSESVVEYVLYMLWDLGFKVGHATRSVDQCVKYAKTDMTIRTSLLDARLIFGDRELFESLENSFSRYVVQGTAREFIEAKMAERDQRHQRSGASRYRVEPNIKDGKGGMRDLHTLHWLAKYVQCGTPTGGAITSGIFTSEEVHTYFKCEDFHWTIRCHLHFLTGKATERLSFDVQPILAEKLGYTDHAGLRAVERFMKHYFLVAKDVGALTGILCSALEIAQLKTVPVLTRLLQPQSWRARRQLRATTEFRIDNGRLNVADAQVFSRDPVNLIRFFAIAEEHELFFHPDAVRLLRRSRRLIDDKLRDDREANRLFLDLLCAKVSPEATLRRMNETGVLGWFIPDFQRVVSMMQFNMYHHYTVDEHLIHTVGVLSRIERGQEHEAHPLASRLIGTIENRQVLYVATFLHDIGKGREEDHSQVGAAIAAELAPRFGLSPADVDTVVWLIEEHLTMSIYAQSRDIADAKTIRDFANIVKTPERLKLLLCLTVADIRAVGPGTWNAWKGQLLRTLYEQTYPVLTADHTPEPTAKRIDDAQVTLREQATNADAEALENFIASQYPDYWLKTDIDQQLNHLELVTRAAAEGQAIATSFETDAFTGVTELSVLAPNHPRLLVLFAGACSAANADIFSAYISTTRDGMALDTFLLERSFDERDDEQRRAQRITDTIERLMRGEDRLEDVLARVRDRRTKQHAFSLTPTVSIDNTISDQFTVIEVSGLDRLGLLYELTDALSELNLDIGSAHVTTFGERAVDVFYVTDLTNKKVTDAARHARIRDALIEVLDDTPHAESAVG